MNLFSFPTESDIVSKPAQGCARPEAFATCEALKTLFQLYHLNYDKINKNFHFDHCAKTVKLEVIVMYLMFLFISFYNK